jgi:ABC-type branched-subunit amino acid transport system substrate-binding protein
VRRIVAVYAEVLEGAAGQTEERRRAMQRYPGRTARKVAAGAAALGALAAIVVSTAVAQASTKGPSVDVYCAAPINTPAASAPQRCSGGAAAFRYIDSHGGIGKLHQKVVFKVCNTNFTPTGEVQCGQEATGDKSAIAMLGPITILSTATFMANMQAAGMPVINPAISDPTIETDSVSFPLGSENFAPAACAVLTAQAVKAKTVGFAETSNPSGIAETNSAIAALPGFGLTEAGNVSFPITASSLSPYVEQLSQNKPGVTVLTASPQDVGGWLSTASSLGVHSPLCVQDALVDAQVLAGLGGSALGVYTAANYPDVDSTAYPLLATFRKQAAAEVAAGDTTASTGPDNNGVEVLAGWLGAQVIIQGAAKAKGAVTHASLLASLNHLTATFGTGKGAILPPINFAKPNPNHSYPRLFNTREFLKEWDPTTQKFLTLARIKAVQGDKIVPSS